MGHVEKVEAEQKCPTVVGEMGQLQDKTVAWSASYGALQNDCARQRDESICVRHEMGQARSEVHDAVGLTAFYRHEAHEEYRTALLARQDTQIAQYHVGRYRSESR